MSKAKKKELSTIQKVKLMNSLAEIATDTDLEKTIKDKPNGDIVYDIFIQAVDGKLKEIMDGKESVEETNQNITSVLQATGRMEYTLQELERFVINFTGTPLMQVLNTLNENLGGKPFVLDTGKVNAAPPAQLPRQRPAPAPQPQRAAPQQQPQQQDNPVAYNPPARSGGGIGSF